MPIPKLESDRLILREWNDSDVAPFAKLNSDPEVMRFFPKPLSLEESKQFIVRSNAILKEKQFGLWATEIKTTGEFIGFIGLAVPNFEAPFTPCTEIGWRLAREFWGKGYATEGALQALKYGFNNLHLNEIVSFTSALNIPSINVMKRLKMRRNNLEDFNHPKVEKGHPLERHVLYRLRRDEFI